MPFVFRKLTFYIGYTRTLVLNHLQIINHLIQNLLSQTSVTEMIYILDKCTDMPSLILKNPYM